MGGLPPTFSERCACVEQCRFSDAPRSAGSDPALASESAKYVDGIRRAADRSVIMKENIMQDTCAACDTPLDETRRTVTIGGKAVEVCCEDCATALREARSSIDRDAL